MHGVWTWSGMMLMTFLSLPPYPTTLHFYPNTFTTPLHYKLTLLYSTLLVMHASSLFYFLFDICLLMKTLRPFVHSVRLKCYWFGIDCGPCSLYSRTVSISPSWKLLLQPTAPAQMYCRKAKSSMWCDSPRWCVQMQLTLKLQPTASAQPPNTNQR
jgi:hypothetical protein